MSNRSQNFRVVQPILWNLIERGKLIALHYSIIQWNRWAVGRQCNRQCCLQSMRSHVADAKKSVSFCIALEPRLVFRRLICPKQCPNDENRIQRADRDLYSCIHKWPRLDVSWLSACSDCNRTLAEMSFEQRNSGIILRKWKRLRPECQEFWNFV